MYVCGWVHLLKHWFMILAKEGSKVQFRARKHLFNKTSPDKASFTSSCQVIAVLVHQRERFGVDPSVLADCVDMSDTLQILLKTLAVR